MHFLVRTIADAGRSPKLPPDQADEFVKAPLPAPQHPAEDASWPDHIVDRTNAAEPAQAHGTTAHATLEFSEKRPGLRITGCSARRKPHDRRNSDRS
jgi:hypothetical protein